MIPLLCQRVERREAAEEIGLTFTQQQMLDAKLLSFDVWLPVVFLVTHLNL